MEKPEINITEVFKLLQSKRFEKTDTLEDIMNYFHEICRKYNIKKGTRNYDESGESLGIQCDNIEWTMARKALTSAIEYYFEIYNILEEPPKDLEAYERYRRNIFNF